jgi:isoaspartyl peptidase/L-asparaginase-like protein (Ntn-hydrolase superfamily)
MKIVMAKTAVDLLTHGGVDAANRAAETAVRLLAERGHGTGGLILLDRAGNPAYAFNTPRMAYGFVDATGAFVVGV